MQAPRPLVPEAPGELDRIAALDRDSLPAPLREANDAAVEDIDCRKELEGLSC
jgi:hypothetical protein